MTQVKICGLRRVDDALVAAEAGAEMLGLVFAPSRRRIEPEAARELVEQVKKRGPTKIVGVFVNENPDEINRLARLCRLDYAQLSGDETDDSVAALDVPAIQVFHVGEDGLDDNLASRVERSSAALVLLDTAQHASYGGTGKRFNWHGGTRIGRPFLLAGGLHAENAAEAVRAMQPWGLDVSSGVETAGNKDPEKIRMFIARVRELTTQSD
jgi:phosphoribosylanthranilate isomerase